MNEKDNPNLIIRQDGLHISLEESSNLASYKKLFRNYLAWSMIKRANSKTLIIKTDILVII